MEFIAFVASIITILLFVFKFKDDLFRKKYFVDIRDKQKYRMVKIGKQTWMAQNLNHNVNNSKCNDEKYGRLYDWDAAKMACPPGWRLPADEDWITLVNSVGGVRVAGSKLKAKEGWRDGNGTDDYGFSALPGGDCSPNGAFGGAGEFGSWWTITSYNDIEAYNWYLNTEGFRDKEKHNKGFYYKYQLFSVRCIKC
jgi:uncharacterized protein (TIGR02145 family)